MIEQRLLTTREAARYIGMSASFLANSRCTGTLPGRTPAPPYLKIGRVVRYDRAVLDQWIDTRARRTPEAMDFEPKNGKAAGGNRGGKGETCESL